jgi:hypothetical protein
MAIIKSANATAKYDKLRRLLGQHRTIAFDLAQWQRIQASPNEQWRGTAVIAQKVTEFEFKLSALDYQIANEMRARLGVPSGTLTVRKEAV